jgi:hypothetical protein
MVQLTRERTNQAIKPGFRGQHKINREEELLRRHRDGEDPRSDVWKGAKPQLKTESAGKCGYCEGKADHVAHGDVEHYRPKSVYWWLAYCYDNYVYSCQICNQSYKSANFPTSGPRISAPPFPDPLTDAAIEQLGGTLAPDPLDDPAVTQFQQDATAEEAHIPDPYAVNPETLFTWHADSVLSEVEVRARDHSVEAQRAIAAAEQFLGLNRQELKGWRWDTYSTAELLALSASAGVLPPDLQNRTEEKLQDMMSLEGEFAAMVRFLVREGMGFPL